MKKYLEVFLHLFVWVVILSYLEGRVASHSYYVNGVKNIGYFVSTNDHLWFWRLSSFFFKGVFFYMAVYGLFPRFNAKKSSSGILVTLGALILSILLLEWIFFYGAFTLIGMNQSGNDVLTWNYHLLNAQILPYAFMLLFSIGYWAARQWMFNYKRLRQLDRTSAELALLKTQINPHFLFNTLNNLFGMAIEKEADELAESIMHLTNMMRYTMYENDENFVLLNKEIDYLQNYIQLQRLRFAESEVPVHIEIKGETEGVRISPMLLINFVENAFKHGISLKKESFVDIRLRSSADEIHFAVINTIHRQYPNVFANPGGSGLKHTRKLLELQYPDRHILKVFEENDLFHAELTLQVVSKREKVLKN